MAGRRFSTSRAGKVEDGQGHRRVHAKRQLCPGPKAPGDWQTILPELDVAGFLPTNKL
jgi:hypothetical protein